MAMEWFRLTLIMVALRRNHVRWWILITDRAIICSIDTAPVPDTCMTPSPVSGVQISPRGVQVYTVQVYTYMTHDTYDTYMTPSPVSGVQISPRVTKKSKFKFFFQNTVLQMEGVGQVYMRHVNFVNCFVWRRKNGGWYISHRVIFVKEKVWHILQRFVSLCEERYGTHPAFVTLEVLFQIKILIGNER